MMEEEWRQIPSFPRYEASSLGRIRSSIRSPNKICRQYMGDFGYMQLNLRRDGKSYMRRVHLLVCEAFHGPKPDWAEIAAHADDVGTNNVPSNLRWATKVENWADRKKNSGRAKEICL